MVWSPVIRVGGARRGGLRRGGGVRWRGGSARRRFARRGRGRSRAGANRFLDEFELVHGNGDIVLTHTEETANTNNHGTHLAVFVQDQFIDVAELFVGLVVDIKAHELGGAPFTLEHHLFGTRRVCGRGWRRAIGRLSSLGIGRTAAERGAQKGDSKELLHRNPPESELVLREQTRVMKVPLC